jgi:hypothetical protein
VLVKVQTVEQAKLRFLVLRETCAAGATTRWKCATCGWLSAVDTTRVPEEHRCHNFRTGVTHATRHFGSEVQA